MYFNIDAIRKPEVFFRDASIFAEFLEVKDGDEYKMYRLQDIELKSGKPFPNAKPIDKYSPEYFKAWQDLDFFASKFAVRSILLGVKNGENGARSYPKFPENTVNRIVAPGGIRIRDLIQLYKQNQISDEALVAQLKKMPDLLPRQCNDSRFARMNDEVTIAELDSYLHFKNNHGQEQPLIAQAVYDRCIALIKAREEHKKVQASVHQRTQRVLHK